MTARLTASSANPYSFQLSSGETASVTAHNPVDWRQPPSYELRQGGSVLENDGGGARKAEWAWLDLSDARWGLSVATRDFWRKGPQRLLAAGDGSVEIQFPAEPYTLYTAMGVAEEVLLDFHPASTGLSTLQSRAHGFLQDPLFPVAPASWYVGSGALGELSLYPSTLYPAYDLFLEDSYQASVSWIEEGHAYGLMNYLDMPIDQYDGAPDPREVSWGNSYYDPAGAQIREFARRGELRWIRDLAGPHIRHWYTTDCYDTNELDHPMNGTGGARGGYHRMAWTGEYHYMESLWDYYYLTGDPRALEVGLRAAKSFADGFIWANDYDIGIGSGAPSLRSLSMKLNTILEGYLASGDPHLRNVLTADWADFLGVFFTAEQFIQPSRFPSKPYDADQNFMQTLLYLPPLWGYFQLTGDKTARAALANVPRRLLEDYRCHASPCVASGWEFFNLVQVTALGGGAYTAVGITPFQNSDDYMYDSAAPALVLALVRASSLTGAPDFMVDARQIFEQRALPFWAGTIWDKPQSQWSKRIAPALAYLDAPPSSGSVLGGPPLAFAWLALTLFALMTGFSLAKT